MAEKFLELMVTPSVARAQKHYFGNAMKVDSELPRDVLTVDEQGWCQPNRQGITGFQTK